MLCFKGDTRNAQVQSADSDALTAQILEPVLGRFIEWQELHFGQKLTRFQQPPVSLDGSAPVFETAQGRKPALDLFLKIDNGGNEFRGWVSSHSFLKHGAGRLALPR